MSEDSDKSVLKLLLELIPQEVPKDYMPYSETDYDFNFHESFDEIPVPVVASLNGDSSLEFKNDSATIFSENFGMLPEIFEPNPMEIEIIEPEQGSKEVLLEDHKDDESIEIIEPEHGNKKVLLVDKGGESLDEPNSSSREHNPDQNSCNETLQDIDKLLQRDAKGINLRDSSRCDMMHGNNNDLGEEASNENFKEMHVRCLSTIETLIQACNSQNLIFNYSPQHNTSVDMIFGHKVFHDETYYYRKWKNLSSEKNSWERSSSLDGSHDIIQYYHAIESSKAKFDIKLLNYFVKDLISRKPVDILTLTKTCALIFGKSEENFKKLKLTISQMKARVKEVLHFPPEKLHNLQNSLLKVMQFREARKKVLINLKEWQQEINLTSTSGYIEVENDVDLETAPSGFQFVNDYINTVIDIPEEPVTFCNCKDCFSEQNTCCPCDSEGQFAYNKHRRLILKPGYPIFECNNKCTCDSNCINRVVQHGQKIKVRIFRTTNNCGWGLQTLEDIEKGQFVLEYLGEIITSEAAASRGSIYDYSGRSYLFDLDYGVDNSMCCYTVDAGHVGNASHFINHSCNPNLHAFAVWINQPDPSLPRLAFFAKRKILKDEELTFDYKMVQIDRFGAHSTAEESKRIVCRCNSKNCRKYLF